MTEKKELLQDNLSSLYQDLQKLQETMAGTELPELEPQALGEIQRIIARMDDLRIQAARLEASRQHLQGISEVGKLINASLDPAVVLQNIVDTIIQLTGAERGFLMLNDGKGHFVTPVARNWDRSSITEDELQVSRTVIQRVFTSGNPVMTTNAQEDPRFVAQESVLTYNLRSILCVPLKLKDHIVGVVYTDHRIQTGIFTESDSEIMRSFANQAAIALENARLYASIKISLAQVTELKQLMSDVFSSIASGVITTDQEEEVIFCNQAAGKILSIKEGSNFIQQLEIQIPDLAGKLQPYLEKTLKNRESFYGLGILSSKHKSREIGSPLQYDAAKRGGGAKPGGNHRC